MFRKLSVLVIFTALALCQPYSTRAQFDILVQHLPEDANTLVLFDMEAILATPMATHGKWREGEQNDFSAGLLMVPPQTLQLAMASQMDIELMQGHWHASAMKLSEEPSMMTVTERYGGNVDEISRQSAAVLPNNTYVIKFGKFIVGSMYPADRQKAARWVDDVFSMSARKPLPTYLAEAVGYADHQKTPIIMAIDLENLLAPQLIRHRLDSMKSLKDHNVDLDKLATALSSVRGATLGLNVTDRISGGLKIDFANDISLMKDFAKPLLLECLSNHGTMIQEFNNWDIQVSTKEILLKGSLGPSGTQRIFSLLHTPPNMQVVETTSDSGSNQKSNPQRVAKASQQYFHSIGLLLNDLTSEDQRHQLTTPGLIAQWYARYAAKIDALPILHVDPDLVTFAAKVSGTLRQSQSAMRGVGAKTVAQISDTAQPQVYDYAAATGPYGGYGYRYAYNPRASMRADGEQMMKIAENQKLAGYSTAGNLMQQITTAMANMRRTMTEKYNIEF